MFSKGGGKCKYKTTICYYFCDEKGIDTTGQTSSETSQGGGGNTLTPPPESAPVLKFVTCKIPCGTKFLRELNFADWQLFVFCGS